MMLGEAYYKRFHLQIPEEDLRLSDHDFSLKYEGLTPQDIFSGLTLYFYARKTTRAEGRTRSLFVNSLSGLQEACFDEDMVGPIAWTITGDTKRWIPITPADNPVEPLKPQGSSNQIDFSAEVDEGQISWTIPIRWQTCAEFRVPRLNIKECNPQFVVGSPGFTNRNYKFKGKTKPKLGAGFIVTAEQVTYDEREYDNHHIKNLSDLQGKPASFYVPVNYVNPKALWEGNKTLGITINYPVTGFLESLGLVERLPPKFHMNAKL